MSNVYNYCVKLNTTNNDIKTAKDLKIFWNVIKSNDSVYEIISSAKDESIFKANEYNKLALDFDGKDIESLKQFSNSLRSLINEDIGFCCVGYFNKSKFTEEDIDYFEGINEIYRDEEDFSKSYLIYFDYIESKDEKEIPDVWSCHLVFNIKITTEEFKTIKDYNIYDLKFDCKAIGACRKFRYVLNNKDGLKRKIDAKNLNQYITDNGFKWIEYLKMSVVQYVDDSYKMFKECNFERIQQETTTITKITKQQAEEEENELIDLLIEDIEEETLKSSFLTIQHLYKYQNGPIPIEFLQKLCMSCLNKFEHKHSIEETTNKFIKAHQINYDEYQSLKNIKSIINDFVGTIEKDDEEGQEKKKRIYKCWYKLINEIKVVSTMLTNIPFGKLDSFNYQFITVRYGDLFYNYNQFGQIITSKKSDFVAQSDLIKSDDDDWILNIKKIDCEVEDWKRKAWFTKYFFNVEPDIEKAKLWLEHVIKSTFKNEKEYEYVMKSLAYKLKYRRTQHNFVFYGPKSTAKTLLGKTFIKIIGEGYRSESLDLEILDRQFNAAELEREFLNFDEVPSDKERKKGYLALMKRLHSDILRSETKGKMAIDKKVFMNYFINCNSESPDVYGYFSEFPTEMEFKSVIGKRIHIIERVETKFDKNILNLIDNKAVILGIKAYLESLDLSDYNDKDEDYMTEGDLEVEKMQKYNRRQDILQYEEINNPCLAEIPDCIRQAIKIKSSDNILKKMKNSENEYMIIIDEIVPVVKISKITLSRNLSEKNYPNIRKERTKKQRLTIITLTTEQRKALNMISTIEE